MTRLWTPLLIFALMVGACSTPSEGQAAPTDPENLAMVETPAPATPPSAPSSETDSIQPELDPDAADAVFLASVETLLEGTSYESSAFETPMIYIETAQRFCTELDAGSSVDELLTIEIEAVSETTITEADADDLRLVGSILGAGVSAYCPDHREAIEATR